MYTKIKNQTNRYGLIIINYFNFEPITIQLGTKQSVQLKFQNLD